MKSFDEYQEKEQLDEAKKYDSEYVEDVVPALQRVLDLLNMNNSELDEQINAVFELSGDLGPAKHFKRAQKMQKAMNTIYDETQALLKEFK